MTVALTEQDSEMVRNMIRNNIIQLLNDTEAKIENPKKFFLTQFNEKEEEDPIKKAPTLNTGKTGVLKEGLELKLQRNILAKYRFDEDLVSKNLIKKRQDFENRINLCQEKQTQLKLKQEKNQQLIKQYAQFINEKEQIRKRAIAKYETELKQRLHKMLECDVLMKELEQVREKHRKISMKVEKNKKYKDFLSKVIELLPENYLEAGESKFTSLMMRHQTLYDTNLDLFENLIQTSDKLKVLRTEYESTIINHNSNKMKINSDLSKLMKLKDQKNLDNTRAEEEFYKTTDLKRDRILELSRLLWGIDNLAEKSLEKYRFANKINLTEMNWSQKLDLIKEYVSKKNEIYKLVKETQLPKIS